MSQNFVAPAPGSRIEVRDAEWLVRHTDKLSDTCWAVHALGISEIVRNKESIFLTDIDTNIRILDPAETELVADTSQGLQAWAEFSRRFVAATTHQTPTHSESRVIP